jgi:hypothetical protein
MSDRTKKSVDEHGRIVKPKKAWMKISSLRAERSVDEDSTPRTVILPWHCTATGKGVDTVIRINSQPTVQQEGSMVRKPVSAHPLCSLIAAEVHDQE